MSKFMKRWASRVVQSAVTKPLKLPSTVRFNEKEKSNTMIKQFNQEPSKNAYLTEANMFQPIQQPEDISLSIDVF